MNVGFWDNSLCERGTTVSLYDYALHNQTILHNKSYIFYDKKTEKNTTIINKFKEHFVVHETDGFHEVDEYIKKYNITHMYIIKYGLLDNRISKIAKNCIHCVFDCRQPHGDVYSAISPYLTGYRDTIPIVPHMIHLPDHNESMREELHIPADAIVFGGYGGKDSFSIPFVHQVVQHVAKRNPHIYFLFANFTRFCPELPNIIHLPAIINLHEKVRFINTTDAMLWGRRDGETFGIAIGEFSSKNKPVIAMKIGSLSHAGILQDKGLWYHNEKTLHQHLVGFTREFAAQKDWNAYRTFTPEKVMEQFNNVYLQ